MADYYAVLKRTLSGFGDANAQLRTKLYERARLTIRGQLENRRPPLDEFATNAEMQKLEQAIAEIEQNYGGEVATPDTVLVGPPKPPVRLEPEPEAESKPQSARNTTSDASANAGPAGNADLQSQPATEPGPAANVEQTAEISTPVQPEPVSAPEPKKSILESVADKAPPIPKFIPTRKPEEPTPISPPEAKRDDPFAKAIVEFTEAEVARVASKSSTADGAGQSAVDYSDPAAFVEPIALPEVPSRKPAESLPDVDFSDNGKDETLVIPPAVGGSAGVGAKRQKSIRWIFLLLLLLALLAPAWAYRTQLAEMVGLSDLFDDPTRPKPVKTISIKPESTENDGDLKPETAPPAETQADEPASAEPTVPEPKREERLTDGGEQVQPETATPSILPEDVTTPGADPAAPAAETTPESTPTSSTQTAILYEEGSNSDDNALDAGTVTWSIAQEAPATGQPEEPAIRAQIEIPGRKTVLIMTIKRNADPALTASHLIELIFAVPDDFAGGAIDTINRYVLKENEQARGETLAAVPVKISDGIFLIALDNLPAAKQKNETLLKSRGWIDIPVQYRTGRRALVTIEKGANGKKVFDEVFAAWAKAAN